MRQLCIHLPYENFVLLLILCSCWLIYSSVCWKTDFKHNLILDWTCFAGIELNCISITAVSVLEMKSKLQVPWTKMKQQTNGLKQTASQNICQIFSSLSTAFYFNKKGKCAIFCQWKQKKSIRMKMKLWKRWIVFFSTANISKWNHVVYASRNLKFWNHPKIECLKLSHSFLATLFSLPHEMPLMTNVSIFPLERHFDKNEKQNANFHLIWFAVAQMQFFIFLSSLERILPIGYWPK